MEEIKQEYLLKFLSENKDAPVLDVYIKLIETLFTSNSSDNSMAAAIKETLPLFQEELENDTALSGLTLDEAVKTNALSHAIHKIAQRLDEEIIPSLGGKQIQDVAWPVDKVNNTIWYMLEKDMGGQIAIAAEKTTSKKQLNIYYSINFENIENNITITRKLEPYDRRVYNALGALWASGQHTVTLGQIYDAMGYVGEPGSADYEKMNASITKMTGAHIYINNAEEAAAYKYEKFVYDASLLPMERVSIFMNGKRVNGAILLYREPPVISFARGRNQITTINKALLTTPLSKTNENLAIEDYLIDRIAHAKTGKLSAKVKYQTIFEKANITDRKQRQRTPAKIKKLLDYYKAQNPPFIKDYKEEEDGIRLML